MASANQVWATLSNNYAAQQNARFKNVSSDLVDLVKRLDDVVAAQPLAAQRNWQTSLKRALSQFRKNNPGLASLNLPDRTELNRALFPICRSIDRPLSSIYIDTTMQRQPDLNWIAKIITNFRAYQAQPIQVYDAGQDRWGGWDGQHTALALYLIAVQGLGMRFEDVVVPVNEYALHTRGQLRGTFISNNSVKGKMAGKKALDIIDIFQQMIYGVEVDGVTEPEWVDAHAKWRHLANAGMFLTAEKFSGIDETGAVSRLIEINESSVEVVRQFAVYGQYVIDSQAGVQKRPINSKEIPIIIEFLNLCEQQDISYTDAEIQDLAQHCIDLFGANFDAKSEFWEVSHQANINAYNKANKGIPTHLWPTAPRNNKNTAQGIAFFWHQLQKSWVPQQAKGFKFPKQPFSMYQPAAKDLF